MSQSELERMVDEVMLRLHNSGFDDIYRVNMAWNKLLEVKKLIGYLEGEK